MQTSKPLQHAEREPRPRVDLGRLAEIIRSVEERGTDGGGDRDGGERAMIATGWPAVDERTGGLAAGAVHEWFGLRLADGRAARPWTPPMCILSHLAWQTIEARPRRWVIWIGRTCWPHPRVLARPWKDGSREGEAPAEPPWEWRSLEGLNPGSAGASPSRASWEPWDRRLLEGSLFVDPPDAGARLWAIDLALRSGAVAAVIADGRGLRLNESRRLQLAAEAGGALALLARPPDEAGRRSAAATRWTVRTAVTQAGPWASGGVTVINPAWEVQLTRCKTRPEAARQTVWRLEWSGESVIPVPADVVERSGQAEEDGRGRRTA